MSFYVEVMCDIGRMSDSKCYSFSNNNPQGNDLKSATKQARRESWNVVGRIAVCPNCQKKGERNYAK